MKAAIVYYSMSGNIKQTAEKIANAISADLIEIKPVKSYPDKGFIKFVWGGKSAVMGEKPRLMPYVFDDEQYDTIIFGSPVWASSFVPPIRSFINENKNELSGKRFAAFMCMSGSGADKALDKLKKELSVTDLAAELVLIDPKDKPDDGNDKKISEFCEKI